jgi:hypothetical protein
MILVDFVDDVDRVDRLDERDGPVHTVRAVHKEPVEHGLTAGQAGVPASSKSQADT